MQRLHTRDCVPVGIEAVRALRQIEDYLDVPIVMITVENDRDVRHRALDAGVTYFLAKPVDLYECLARCRNLLLLRWYLKGRGAPPGEAFQ